MKDDVVSRQAAIDALEDYMDNNTLDGYEDSRTLIEIIKALPSAQPEPCDDPRADVYYLAEKIGIHRLYALVVELRGEPEPCEDAYMKAVWTWLLNYQIKVAELKGRYTPYEVLSWVANDWRKEHECAD